MADNHRVDLAEAGIGIGHHAFNLPAATLPWPLGPCFISVQDDATGEELSNSPKRLEGPLNLSDAASKAITALLDVPGTDNDLRERAEFAAGQADRLLSCLSQRRSRAAERAVQRARNWRWRSENSSEAERMLERALVINSTLPVAGRNAASDALLSYMRSLRRLGFDVLFAPADMRAGTGLKALEAIDVQCATEPWSASVEELIRRESSESAAVYLQNLDVVSRYISPMKHYMPNACRVYSITDLYSTRLTRHPMIESYYELENRTIDPQEAELNAVRACHVTITHSIEKAACLRKMLSREPVSVMVVPWHVSVQPTSATFEERSGIAFVGNYYQTPDVDAALLLMDRIMPFIWRTSPTITCTVVGNDVPRKFFEGRDQRIKVVG